MNKIILGATLVLGLAIGAASPTFAAGDGLDKDASSQGNGRFGGMHRGARMGSRAAMMHRRHRRRHHH